MSIPPAEPTQLSASQIARARYTAQPTNWVATLELWFEPSAGKTRLMRRRHHGPLVVQRPFHPERDGTCHVYLLHPPGGVAGGDQLNLHFHLAADSRALMTTPAATKFYRSEHGASTQSTRIDVGPGAVCEYLPQETIVFDGADAHIDLQVSLASDASYVGWDFLCLGRPAARERFETGRLSQRLTISRFGKPIWFERMALAGGSPIVHAAFSLAGQPTWGTMVYAGAVDEGAAERVRAAIGDSGKGVFSVSQLEQVVVCRYLGPRVADGKSLFARAWDTLRMSCQGKTANVPRIWAT
ncbi:MULTISPECIES: urease accessory protein UreD [unclassified Chelatococcus]|uniref:urease accessory protein UreD n=1 Tax=unclassified Chelatococcus TaxID=2638111 RepID=UPI001BCADCF5|nr:MULTISPECIES: urease accessory protein UreD [unclassified Chelatococcus]MBS7698894.1 urease accessory protein UreD [Chelatococcus sp. YT9]MBX3559530.1 urease accessory protein UreD [Chelatococcus sp.]